MTQKNELSEYESNLFNLEKIHCREKCGFNKNHKDYSISQYEMHWKTKKHISFDLTTLVSNSNVNNIQNNIYLENTSENYFQHDFGDDNFSENIHMNNFGDNDFLENVHRNNFRIEKNIFYSSTELNFYYWEKVFAPFLPRDSLRSLKQLVFDPTFHNLNVPTEHRVKSLDIQLSNHLFNIKSIEFEGKNISFMPLSEIIRGCILDKNFIMHVLISNKILPDNSYDDLDTSISEMCKSDKFKSIVASKSLEEVFISLVIFSDDFAKEKRSKWWPIDSIYISFGNLPLKKKFLHHNVFVFSIFDNMTYYKSIELLVNSVKEFNEENLEFYFEEIEMKLKMRVFIQCFSCDNPRAMSILNLSIGKANKYCRSCLTSRNEFLEFNRKINILHHIETLNQIISNQSLAARAQKDFGIKFNHQIKLHEEKYFELFEDFPFDILHSVYLGLVRHALTDTIKQMNDVEKNLFLCRFRCLYLSGIEYLPAGNIVKNSKSMTGKDFKAIRKVIMICLEYVRVSDRIIVVGDCNYPPTKKCGKWPQWQSTKTATGRKQLPSI